MTDRLSKRNAFVLLAVPTLLLLLLTTRTWVTGRTDDPVLGQATVAVTGSQAAPAVVALGAVALAALVAVFTGGPRIRRVSAVLLTLAAVGATVLTVLVLADPAAAVARKAAEQLGRTGGVGADASLTAWPWPAAVLAAVLSVTGGLTVVAVGRWDGLSSRFDRPVTAESGTSRGTRRSTWDDLSEGRDPTAPVDDDHT